MSKGDHKLRFHAIPENQGEELVDGKEARNNKIVDL